MNRRQLQIFSMPNISWVSAMTSDRVFGNSHCAIVTRVNEHRFASDVGHLLAIYQNLSASEKIWLKSCSVNLALRWALNNRNTKSKFHCGAPDDAKGVFKTLKILHSRLSVFLCLMHCTQR